MCSTNQVHKEVVVQSDTIVFRDTIRELQPVEKEVIKTETMLVAVTDTIRVHDTLYVEIGRERKIYSSEEYYAEVSGYRPCLDYIEVYPKTQVVTRTEREVRDISHSLSLGIEANYLDRLYTPIYFQYERMLHKNLSFYGKIGYDLPSELWGVGIGVRAKIEW